MSDDVNFNRFVSSLEKQFIPSEETVINAISITRGILRKYVATRNLRSLVVGLYGDLDSTVVAAICQEEYIGVPLLGVVVPSDLKSANTFQAHWAGKKLCTAYHELINANYMQHGINDPVFKDYIDENVDADSEMLSRLQSTIFQNLARKTNGIVIGNKTWSDLFATFLYHEGEADYFPLRSVNKGFELPAFAKQLNIPAHIINTPADTEELIGATYREVDVIINGHLGNFDDNLNTQLQRFKNLEKVHRVLLRFTLNNISPESLQSRALLKLPTNYRY